jgi:glucose-6-phosphate 1-dehydrogenase
MDSVESAWSLLDPFLSRWKESPGRDLFFYPAGSWGPREAEALFEGRGSAWRTP